MYSTKYALSGGIKEFEPSKAFDNQFVYDGPYTFLKIGRDAFHTFDEARADAEKRRQKRIASLRKQIKALEAMTF
jgi:hypothetical protein